ncbi:MAG TPA: hypothetical protein PLG57_10335 [Bacteroidia bacterium]|nr:hypothetical protein [Bacteroidia bacterium]HQF28459.1 hypothetical protein [Bacteroidia bacterium]
MLNKQQKTVLVVIGLILLVPFIAMQFTSEVQWTFFDFVVAFVLLLSVGFSCEWILRKVQSNRQRLLFCFLLVFVFGLIWAELAIGIFGTPFAGS